MRLYTPGTVLSPVGGDKPLNVTLPLGVAPGAPAQVQVPGFGFGAASGTTHVFVAPPVGAAVQLLNPVDP